MEQPCKDGKKVEWQVWVKREFPWQDSCLALLDKLPAHLRATNTWLWTL